MNEIDMHFLLQNIKLDSYGYNVPTGKSHIGKTYKSLCGKNISTTNFGRGDISLKQWLVDLTTCKKCKKIAEKILAK